MKNKLRNLIAEDETKQAIQLLLAHTKGTNLHNQVIMQSAKYENYEELSINGLISREEGKTTLGDVNHSLLLIIEKFDEIKEKLPKEEESPEQSIEPKKEPESKKDIWKIIGYVALIIGILAGIAEITGKNISNLFVSNKKSEPFSVTVLVHGKEGRDQLILKKQGKVILDIGGDRKEEAINEQGQATFIGLPGKYQGDTALISVAHSQPYFPIDRDKKYKLTEKVIYLPIELTGLNKIKGRVIDADSEDHLDSVRVSVENVATHTDEFGWFELEIPEEKQTKFLRVNFFKKGYKIESLNDIAPHTNQEIQITLQKK